MLAESEMIATFNSIVDHHDEEIVVLVVRDDPPFNSIVDHRNYADIASTLKMRPFQFYSRSSGRGRLFV